jgi:hypothetical protein
LTVLLHVYVLHRCIAVVHEANTVPKRMETGLLRRRLRRGSKEIGNLLDTLGEV